MLGRIASAVTEVMCFQCLGISDYKTQEGLYCCSNSILPPPLLCDIFLGVRNAFKQKSDYDDEETTTLAQMGRNA